MTPATTLESRDESLQTICATEPIDGVIDCQDDFSFTTQRQTYTVYVFQLFRRMAFEQFTLRLAIQ